MNKPLVKIIILLSLTAVAQTSTAKDWFGKNNRFGGFGGSNNCSDWPEWTPMYWMEEMMGNNDNCSSGYGYGGNYGGIYPYQPSPYAYGAGTPGAYGAAVNPYLMNPYAGAFPAYGASPYAAQARAYPRTSARRAYGARKSGFSPFTANQGFSGFPQFGGSNFSNPFSSFSGAKSPFSSFGGGGSPWSSYTSPMGFGGMPGMSPMSPFSPMGGFGSPMTMGMPGMSPMSGFGSNPFGGGSSFMPFR